MTTPQPAIPAWLPPQPDPQTGQPRPPRAPTTFASNESTPTNRPARNHPPLPEGQGPTLEWRQDTAKGALGSGVIAAAIVAVVPTLETQGFGWVTTWYWWPSIALAGLLIYLIMRASWLAAGARWLQYKDQWVDTYELTHVHVQASGANMMLRLTDSAGRSIGSLTLKGIQRNQALWDLVYNGILHSVVTGRANPPTNVRTLLKLPGGTGQHRDGS